MNVKIEPHNEQAKVIKRKKGLSNEEKLDLMVEYLNSIEGTDETFTSDTVYKGYNIGHMRVNLRTSYWSGTLNIDDELLQKFKEYGIIIEKPTRIRTTTQEKYDFLISMIGKKEKELRSEKMESGLTYSSARNYIQNLYNRGKLDLSPEQIEILKKNNILNISTQEMEKIEKQYGFPKKYANFIVQEYGSVENYIEMFKRGECDFRFNEEIFIGATTVAVSEKDMTVKQKLLYQRLCSAIMRNEEIVGLGSYINVDALEEALSELTEEEQKIIRLRFGLDDGLPKTLEDVAKNYFGITKEAIRSKEQNILWNLRVSKRSNPFFVKGENIDEIDEELEKINAEENEIYNIEEQLIQDSNFNQEFFEEKVINFYKELSKKIQEKEMLKQRKERHKEFLSIYEPAEEEYLNNEDIFDPDYIIKGTNIKKLKEIKDIPEKKSIYDPQLPTMLLVYLHHSGINTIEDLLNIPNSTEKLKEILNSIKDIDENEKEQIIEYMSKENLSIKDTLFRKTIDELGLNTRAFNTLYKAGLKTVEDVLKCYKKGYKGWNSLLNHGNAGEKTLKEILDKLEGLGAIKDGKPVVTFEINKDVKKKIEKSEQQSIDNLNLSARAYNCLLRGNLKTVEDILKCYDEESGEWKSLIKIRNMGRKCIEEVLGKLEELGVVKDGKPVIDSDKEELIENILEKQQVIKEQQAELSELKDKRRNLNEQE